MEFLKFRPGLVGGHCIGVDPYYLTYKSEMLGYHPQVVLAGRRINDSMSGFIADKTIKEIIKTGGIKSKDKILVLGITFKENCCDVRNSKAVDLVLEFKRYGVIVDVYDPVANKSEVKQDYDIDLIDIIHISSRYKALVAAVSHEEFLQLDYGFIKTILSEGGVVIDVKSIFDLKKIKDAGIRIWRL